MQLLAKQLVSSTAMGTQMCCSSQPKRLKRSFRPTASDAMSYFVGHKAVEKGHLEDAGFAINGGKGWLERGF